MSRMAPIALAVMMAVAMVVALFNTEDATMSAVLAVRAGLAAVIVGLSVAFGVGAADGTVSSGRRIRSLVEAMPVSARFRFGCRRIGSLAVGAFAGMAFGCLMALAVAWFNESPPSWQALANLPVGWVCVSAFAALGWGIGVMAKSWLVPPLLAVVPFAALVGNVGPSRAFIEVFEGTGTTAVVSLPAPDIYFASLGSFVAVGLLGLALVFGWSHRWSLPARVVAAGATAVLLVMGVVMGHVHDTTRLFVGVDTASWPCADVKDSRAVVCIPPDQERDLAAVAADLGRYHERVVQIDPSLAGRRWSPLDEPPGAALTYDLPLGHPAADVDQAPAIVSGLTPPRCYTQGHIPAKVWGAVKTLQSWVAPWANSSGEPVTLADAQAAYRLLQSCP